MGLFFLSGAFAKKPFSAPGSHCLVKKWLQTAYSDCSGQGLMRAESVSGLISITST